MSRALRAGDPMVSGADIAVLITYHDERELLTDCLNSLFSGGQHVREILVYDDASTWPAADYLMPGAAVRVIRGESNRGPSFGRNTLLTAASAEYVHFHDADDLFRPDWAQEVSEALKQTDSDVVFTEICSSRAGTPVASHVLGLAGLRETRDLVAFAVRGSMLVPSGTYRRRMLLAIGGYDESLVQAEDYEFHVRLALRGPRYACIERDLVEIRLRPDSRSTRTGEVYSDAVRAVRKVSAVAPRQYHRGLAAFALGASRKLAQHGELKGAMRGFELVRELVGRTFPGQPLHYRIAASILGPLNAEKVGAQYRRIPTGVRRLLRR